MDLDLIVGIDYGSGGLDPSRSPATARLAGNSFPVAARHGNVPDFTELDAPGVISARVWVGEVQRDSGDPPRALARGCRGCSSGGGAAAAELAGVRVRATPGLGSGVKRLGVLARGSNKLGQGLRGVLQCSSELAMARPRLRVPARVGS